MFHLKVIACSNSPVAEHFGITDFPVDKTGAGTV
jgi:hypothetical protein